MQNKQTIHPDINFYAQIMQSSLFIIVNSFAKNVKKVHEKKIDKNLNNENLCIILN
jgi:phage antirepressor YoqD-like protein